MHFQNAIPTTGLNWRWSSPKSTDPTQNRNVVQHQKATAHWQCSIWPNMERKNAAFSRNQTGEEKKKKGEVFLQAACTARWSSLASQRPQTWLHLRNGVIDCDVGPAVTPQCWAQSQTRTPARLESWEENARWPFLYADNAFFKNTPKKALLALTHTSSLTESLQRTAIRTGTFLLVKNQPSPTPQTSA